MSSAASIIRSYEARRATVEPQVVIWALETRPGFEQNIPAISEIPEDWFVVEYNELTSNSNIHGSVYFIIVFIVIILFHIFEQIFPIIFKESPFFSVIAVMLIGVLLFFGFARYRKKSATAKFNEQIQRAISAWRSISPKTPPHETAVHPTDGNAFDVPPQQ